MHGETAKFNIEVSQICPRNHTFVISLSVVFLFLKEETVLFW